MDYLLYVLIWVVAIIFGHIFIKLPYNWQFISLNKFSNRLFKANFIFSYLLIMDLTILCMQWFGVFIILLWSLIIFLVFFKWQNIIIYLFVFSHAITFYTNKLSSLRRHLITMLILAYDLVTSQTSHCN